MSLEQSRPYDAEELAETVHDEFNRLRGKICGFLEACGLPERQERGAIATFKNLTYDSEKTLVDLITK